MNLQERMKRGKMLRSALFLLNIFLCDGNQDIEGYLVGDSEHSQLAASRQENMNIFQLNLLQLGHTFLYVVSFIVQDTLLTLMIIRSVFSCISSFSNHEMQILKCV